MASANKCASVTCPWPISFDRATWLEETIDTSSAQNSWPGKATMRPNSWMASMGDRACGTTLEFEDTRTKPLCVMGQVAHPSFASWREANHRCALS